MTYILRSERVLTGGAIISADIVIQHDYIAEVCAYGSYGQAHDLGSRLVVPGFVDLHSDAIEKEIEPRPGASFPIQHAMVDLDKKLAMSGITTMFHAIAFNDESLVGQRGTETAARTIRELHSFNKSNLLVDNLIHARYEITSFDSIPELKKLLDEGTIQLLSLMDHSPGQGQFRSLESWKKYHIPTYNIEEQDVENFVNDKIEKRSRCLFYMEDLCSHARKLGITLASHDDDSTEKIDLMQELGITIAEFPLNVETATYAQEKNMPTGMGAPNVVRGKSQSGNISARDLIARKVCSFLCSDYHPCSMLQAVYSMHNDMNIDLAEAFTLVTSAPSKIVNLEDRGEILKGKLADILVIEEQDVPKIVMTLKSGSPIYNSVSCFCSNEYA